ncbi:MAG: xanthine dehydrogenase family protein subunit M [Magnetovibrio sp.]|nr:xanthine dehydrogenase family protein subunit M [Magnetovibrio sp.]
MHDFNFIQPKSAAAAADALAGAEDGQYMAGGQTLIPVLKQRLAMPTDVVDLSAIPGLAGIEVSGGAVRVGAMTTHAAVAASGAVRDAVPALAHLAGLIGDPHVRNRGTLGGSIANNDPAADYPAAVLGLGATVVTESREIAADDFFTDLFETALDDGELVTRVDFPVPDAAAYVKFPNPASRYAIVGVFVSRAGGAVRVAVTGAGPCVFRQAEMEAALSAEFSAEAIAGVAIAADDLNNDLHASAEYRAHLVGVMARRAVAEIA